MKGPKILVAIDESPLADDVMRIAAEMAKRFVAEEVHVVHVVSYDNEAAATGLAVAVGFVEQGRSILDRVVGKELDVGSGRCTTHLTFGDPASEIVRLANDLETDLVIVGTRGRGAVKRALLGSVATKVMHEAPCAVLVARTRKELSVPATAPPCPDCVARRQASGRVDLWCDRHATRHTRAHLHYEYPQSYGVGSMLVRP